jgi:hypothetical protein
MGQLPSMMKRDEENRCLWAITAVLVVVCVFVLLPLVPAEAQSFRRRARQSQRQLATHRQKHRELQRRFSAELERLAGYCEDNKLTEAAANIRKLAAPVSSEPLGPNSLPRQVRPAIPAALPAAERYWQTQLRFAQEKFAKDLYLLSRRVLYAGSPSYAYDLVREVVRHDPDHKTARRLLGRIRSGNEWVTPFAAKMKRRSVWHEKYGWLLKTRVAKYEQGQRYFKGRWITVAQETEIRRDFNFAWEIRTDHYLVKTNHSLERGVEVATALEEFYETFVPLFAAFFNTPEQIEKLFNGNGSSSIGRQVPYKVHYYHDRDEYNRRLLAKIPQIANTNGLYYTTDRTAYFYHDPNESNEHTLYHEATHQLFYESASKDRPIALRENFWIVEGIACYMESFSRGKGRLSLGDPRYDRFKAARHRYLVDDYFVPLADFSRMGMFAFQNDRNMRKNYSQASGLAHFFMHYSDGRYRDALVQHLSQIYHPNQRFASNAATLADLTSTDFKSLDRQYGDYLQHIENGLKRLEQKSRE